MILQKLKNEFWVYKKLWKKSKLGTSDAWSMSRSSHRPREPAYYIEDCRILRDSKVFSYLLKWFLVIERKKSDNFWILELSKCITYRSSEFCVSRGPSHTVFFFPNLFHSQITQIYIVQISSNHKERTILMCKNTADSLLHFFSCVCSTQSYHVIELKSMLSRILKFDTAVLSF